MAKKLGIPQLGRFIFISLFLIMVNSLYAEGETRGINILPTSASSKQQVSLKLYDKAVALLIGIDKYPALKPSEQLKYAVNDAKGVGEVLAANYQFDKIHTLYNEQATKKGINDIFLQLGRELEENDALFVFFAGHGTRDELGYLLPYDGSFNPDEYDNLNIPLTNLENVFGKRIKAKHIFYVIDACYSGSLFTATRGGVYTNDRSYELLKQRTSEPVRYALTAGASDQEVLDGGYKNHSVFTGRLIQTLENASDFITANGLSEDIKQKVFLDAKDKKHTQTPMANALSGQGEFVFVRQSAQNSDSARREAEEAIKRTKELADLIANEKDQQKSRELQQQKEQAEKEAKTKAKLAEDRAETERIKREEEAREQQIALQKQQREKEEETRILQMKAEAEAKLAQQQKEWAALKSGPDGLARTIKDALKSKEDETKRITTAKNTAIQDSNKGYDSLIAAAKKVKKDEYITDAEFKQLQDTEINRHEYNKYQRQQELSVRYERELQTAIAPYDQVLRESAGNTVLLKGSDIVKVEIAAFDLNTMSFPLTITMSEKYGGLVETYNLEVVATATERRAKAEAAKAIASAYVGALEIGIDIKTGRFIPVKMFLESPLEDNTVVWKREYPEGAGIGLKSDLARLEAKAISKSASTIDAILTEADGLTAKLVSLKRTSPAIAAEASELDKRINAIKTEGRTFRASANTQKYATSINNLIREGTSSVDSRTIEATLNKLTALDATIRKDSTLTTTNQQSLAANISNGMDSVRTALGAQWVASYMLDINRLSTEAAAKRLEVTKIDSLLVEADNIINRTQSDANITSNQKVSLRSRVESVKDTLRSNSAYVARQKKIDADTKARLAKEKADFDRRVRDQELQDAMRRFWSRNNDPPASFLSLGLTTPTLTGDLLETIETQTATNAAYTNPASSLWAYDVAFQTYINKFIYIGGGVLNVSSDLEITKLDRFSSTYQAKFKNYGITNFYVNGGFGFPLGKVLRAYAGGYLGAGSLSFGNLWTSQNTNVTMPGSHEDESRSLTTGGLEAGGSLYLGNLFIDLRFRSGSFTVQPEDGDTTSDVSSLDNGLTTIGFGLAF